MIFPLHYLGLNGQREGVTVNVAKIAGGGPLNVVADNAVVRFNVRVPDAQASAWAPADWMLPAALITIALGFFGVLALERLV